MNNYIHIKCSLFTVHCSELYFIAVNMGDGIVDKMPDWLLVQIGIDSGLITTEFVGTNYLGATLRASKEKRMHKLLMKPRSKLANTALRLTGCLMLMMIHATIHNAI